MCGVHRTYMGHLERGEKNVSFRSMVRVATALNVTLSELFTGLEAGESEAESHRVGRARLKPSERQAELNRGRVLKELATLERTVRTLKEITLIQNEPATAPHARTRKAVHPPKQSSKR